MDFGRKIWYDESKRYERWERKDMNMKKILTAMLCIMLAIGMINAGMAEHVHAPKDGWDRDAREHWQVCECGEKLEAQAHVIGEEDVVCTICGSEVWVWEDGYADVNNYDEEYMPLRSSVYNAEGNVLSDYVYVYEYDEENGLTIEKTYYTGEEWPEEYALISEMVYRVDEEGWDIAVSQTSYFLNGQTENVSEYDEYGNVAASQNWEEDGTPLMTETYEYVYGEDGQILYVTEKGQWNSGETFHYETNEYGDSMLSAFYNADGTLDFEFRNEYGYDENGFKLWKKQYLDGELYTEEEYVVEEDEYGDMQNRLSVSVEYFEDGTKTVCEYDEEENPVKGTDYDAEGNVIRVYTYDEEGNIVE